MNARGKLNLPRLEICVLALVVLSACATKYANPAKASNIMVEILPSKDKYVEIKDVSVYQDGNKLLVTGKAKKKGSIFTAYKGHIDVAVVFPAGEPVQIGWAEYRHNPSRNIINSFEVNFQVPTKPETKVFLVFHPLDGSASEHSGAVERLLTKAS